MTSDNPFWYRKFLIVVIDLLLVFWLIYIYFVQFEAGYLFVFGAVFLILYNIYVWIMVSFFPTGGRVRIPVEGFYVIMLAAPFAALWYFI